MKLYYAIIGAGGYGREVMPIARQSLKDEMARGSAELIFVAEGEIEQAVVNGHRVISLDEFKMFSGEKHFNIAIGNSAARERIADDCLNAGMKAFSVVADNNVIFDNNIIGEGCIFSPFTAISSNSRIGYFFHANFYSYVGHDCVIGDYVTFAPNVHCNGNVVIEDHVYVGTGAIIKQGTKKKPVVIGHHAIVGMGSVVNKNVPPHSTVFGNPARLLRSLKQPL